MSFEINGRRAPSDAKEPFKDQKMLTQALAQVGILSEQVASQAASIAAQAALITTREAQVNILLDEIAELKRWHVMLIDAIDAIREQAVKGYEGRIRFKGVR